MKVKQGFGDFALLVHGKCCYLIVIRLAGIAMMAKVHCEILATSASSMFIIYLIVIRLAGTAMMAKVHCEILAACPSTTYIITI